MSTQQSEHNKLLFKEKEDVLCFHGPLLYEAKVLKAEIWTLGDSEIGNIGPHYYVHYKGWKASYDEWVPNARVLKYNQDNLQEQTRLKEKHTQYKKKKVGIPKPVTQEDQPIKKKPSTVLGALPKSTASKSTKPVENMSSESNPVSQSGRTLKPTEKKEEIKKHVVKKDEIKSENGKDKVRKEAVKEGKEKDIPQETIEAQEKPTNGKEKPGDEMDIDPPHLNEKHKVDNSAKQESLNFVELIGEIGPQEQDISYNIQDHDGKRKFAEIDKSSEFTLPLETEAFFQTRPEVEIRIPEPLQVKLVDDWETVSKLGLRRELARPITFNEILRKWVEYQRKQDMEEKEDQNKGNSTENNEAVISPPILPPINGEANFKSNTGANDAKNDHNIEIHEDSNPQADPLKSNSTAKGKGGQEALTLIKNTTVETELDEQEINEAEVDAVSGLAIDANQPILNYQKIEASDDAGPSSAAVPQVPTDIYDEVAEGLKKYFERTLSHTLLYNSERPTLAELLKTKPNQIYGDIFGAEHMLRFFVKLPEFLAHTEIEYDCVQELSFRITQIMAFLMMNIHEFFDPSPNQANSLEVFTKKPRINPPQPRKSVTSWRNQPGLTCANCETQDTPGWRVGSTQDEKLCNACGLYYAKHRIQRPSNLWGLIRSKRKA
ncbi:hypothetical protein G9A89_020708 [Geosiphon pyriformis]|nr:hypothetical protein G9A89_020708 [Geosiphon pyriformis]